MDTIGEGDDRWTRWKTARPEPSCLHLDAAAAGRSSLAVQAAASDHALLEAKVGAYVAQEMAAGALSSSRAALGRLLGMPEEGIAFVESASAALSTLLTVWPLGAEPTIGVAPSEWGPNLAAFARRGFRLLDLPVHADGHIDLAALARLLASTAPSAVHITQVASHRPLVQPVAEMAVSCQRAGVPLFVDAAQALGHVDTVSGADVIYATSRKWLGGPRGVGVLSVSAQWFGLLRPILMARQPDSTDDGFGALLGSREAHIAGRLGLGVAALEHLDLGASAVRNRLAAVGRATRQMLGALDDWEVIGPVDEPTAISSVVPTSGQNPGIVRTCLLERHGILTTAQHVFRAPRDMTTASLRVSPHVDCTDDDLLRLRTALASLRAEDTCDGHPYRG